MKRAILIVLDSVGIGAAPDAADYGDSGANTLVHTAAAVGGLNLPCLQKMGLGNIPALLAPCLESGLRQLPRAERTAHLPRVDIALRATFSDDFEIPGVPPAKKPLASYGAMREISKGKDTITGHWEMAGLELQEGFRLFPKENSFPSELIRAFESQTGRKVIGNRAASGTVIIEELGEEQLKTGAWIVYTSADSVFQIAAHEKIIPLDELYRACEIARKLGNPYRIGRIIARPYIGEPGGFARTKNRRDYSFPMPEPTVLDRLTEAGISVFAVGKIEDIFDRRGITESFHTGNNADSQSKIIELLEQNKDGLIFANLIDFDMLYGHRRDASGYARALEQTDSFLEKIVARLKEGELLIITADHGNDPAFRGTDHTREYVPLLVYQPGKPGRPLGVRRGFYDVARSLAEYFGPAPSGRGKNFLS